MKSWSRIVATLIVIIGVRVPALSIHTSSVQAQDFSRAIEKSRPAVALVFVEETNGDFSSGTGFAVADSSVLVTAAHVVSSVKEMVVRYGDGSVHEAQPIFIWYEKDVALLRVSKIPSIRLGGRQSPVRVGEPVVVVGYPLVDKLGISQVSVTSGIVSAVRSNAIQLSVAVNSGNSGGPVLDISGNVIGVVSSTLPGTGFAIASPWEAVRTAVQHFKRDAYPVLITAADGKKSITGWIEQGTLAVDARTLATLLNGAAFWNPGDKTLTLAVGGKRIAFTEGSRYMDVDGTRIVLPLPMRDRKIPIKPVLALLGGSLEINLASATATVRVGQTVGETKPPPPAAAQPTPTQQAPPKQPPLSLDIGPRELFPGVGAGPLQIGMAGAEVARLFGPPTRRRTYEPLPELLYRPVAHDYDNYGISILFAEGRLWGFVITSSDWSVEPFGLRVGDTRTDVISALGSRYEVRSQGTMLWYANLGIAFSLSGENVTRILVFPKASSQRVSVPSLGQLDVRTGFSRTQPTTIATIPPESVTIFRTSERVYAYIVVEYEPLPREATLNQSARWMRDGREVSSCAFRVTVSAGQKRHGGWCSLPSERTQSGVYSIEWHIDNIIIATATVTVQP